MRFYWIQEESSGVLEFDKISSYPAGSAEESQSSANFNEKPRILHAEMVEISYLAKSNDLEILGISKVSRYIEEILGLWCIQSVQYWSKMRDF